MNRRQLLAIFLVAAIALIVWRGIALYSIQDASDVTVAFVIDPQEAEAHTDRITAWDSYAVDRGIPHVWLKQRDLVLLDATALVRRYSAIVFPDGLNAKLDDGVAPIVSLYVRGGGTLAVVDDTGTQRSDGRFLDRAALADVTGCEYLRYDALRARAFGLGIVRFASMRAAQMWHVPPGKLSGANELSSYIYGGLTYPVRATQALSDVRVDASSSMGPVLTERQDGSGRAYYVGLPLGYLRGHSDAFPLHIAMSRIVLDVAATPHLVSAPDARGAMVVNWHIDSNNEWTGIPNLGAQGLLRHDVRYTFDVTAGPDVNAPGDNEGFDACGAGLPYLRTIQAYGSIGSHGGWIHNDFAREVEHNDLSYAQMRGLIAKNSACLRREIGMPIVDYAAPVGVHPQPEMTDAIASLGIRAYYYTGDTGAPVERAIYNGKMVSKTTWAFPIVPYGRFASIAEMRLGHVPPSGVKLWLESTLEQSERDRSIYLVYSHGYDMLATQYGAPFRSFLDKVERDQRAGIGRVVTMGDASAFMQRFIQTSMHFIHRPGRIDVRLTNPRGLKSVGFALPRAWFDAPPSAPGVSPSGSDATFYYFCVRDDRTSLDATFSGASSTL
jgi:hypothetical protein